MKWRCCMMLLSATLLVILVRSIGSFWQLRWYWFRHTKPRTYAYGIISHMATVSTTISKNTNDVVTSRFDQRSILFTLHFHFLSSNLWLHENLQHILLEETFGDGNLCPHPYLGSLAWCAACLLSAVSASQRVISKSHGKWRVDSRRPPLGC